MPEEYNPETGILIMTKTIILMRHAEAVDRMEAEDDFQRGLTSKGREDSLAAGKVLAKQGLKPDIALVSPAWRTEETYRCLLPALGDPKLEDPMALYHASTDMLERAALEALETYACILMVGHNPGMGGFAHKLALLAGCPEQLPRGYPPASATVFSLKTGDLTTPRLVTRFMA